MDLRYARAEAYRSGVGCRKAWGEVVRVWVRVCAAVAIAAVKMMSFIINCLGLFSRSEKSICC